MAKPTNTLVTSGHSAPAGIGMREDLSDDISMISPEEVPLHSWMENTVATNSLAHEWQTLALRAPAKNAVPEGDVFVPTPNKTTIRLANTCQISTEVASVSGTTQAVRTAGRAGQLDYQMLLKGAELRRDVEYGTWLATGAPAQVRKQTDPRENAPLSTWVSAATASIGAGGTDPTGNGLTAVVDGTARNLDIDIVNAQLAGMWVGGARPSLMMMGPDQKLNFDTLAAGSNLADNQYTLPLNGGGGVVFDVTVSVFKSAFGSVKMMLNQWMANNCIYIFDERPQFKPKKAVLSGRNFVPGNPQLNFDGKSNAVIFEGCLEVPNPSAVGLITALNV